MNLRELLKQKILEKEKKPTNLQKDSIKNEYPDSDTLAWHQEQRVEFYTATSIEPPPPELYSICISLLIKRTYTSIIDTRDLLRFLLSPYAYTLNTFRGLNHDELTEIFNLFMLHFPPRNSYHLHALYLTLWELELKVPAKYYEQIVDSIKKWGLDKKSKIL